MSDELDLLDIRIGPLAELAQLISEVSEDCYCAGWLSDCEHTLWDMANDPSADLRWGMGEVPRASLRRMLKLAECTDHWVRWDDQRGGVHPIDLDAWKRKHAAWRARR